MNSRAAGLLAAYPCLADAEPPVSHAGGGLTPGPSGLSLIGLPPAPMLVGIVAGLAICAIAAIWLLKKNGAELAGKPEKGRRA